MYPIERAFALLEDLQVVIDHMAATNAETWQTDVVRSTDGSRNCFFGHLFQWAEDTVGTYAPDLDAQTWANAIWNAFEDRWSTTYAIYPVNDGENDRYQQPLARDRVVAYLEALRDGRELTTEESMERDFQASLAAEAAAH